MEINDTASGFIIRTIRQDEIAQAVAIEQICFPPNEACSPSDMEKRIKAAPDMFLVAEDKSTGKLAGFLNGLSTKETSFRDEFFTDPDLNDPEGDTVMLLGLDVLPEYRRRGLASALMREYAAREKKKGRARLILTCHSFRIDMYRKMGYESCGVSASVWGGEEWFDMILTL